MYFNNIYEKFKRDDFKLQKDKIDSFDVTVATKKQFKISWLATQMKFFAIMGFSKNITKETIKNYSKNCIDYAKKNKNGLPIRGLQSGVASFALLVSSNVDEDAKKFAQERPKNISQQLKCQLFLI